MPSNDSCRQFLSRHHLLAAQYDTKEIIAAFLSEMEKGLAGQESSLAMIPSFIPVPDKAPKDEKIIVLDAGGTNFRTALVRFDRESVPHIDYFTNNSMPGIDKEVDKESFFNQIGDFLKPVLAESGRLGFCFSYPTLIDRQRDGKLLYWTKEVKAPSIVGEKILAGVAAMLRKRGLPCPSSMLILNDTVSSLLAGVTATRFSPDYNYIGLILGTGTNTAYVESVANILKEKGLPKEGSMAINCESANFNKFIRGDLDLAYDATTSSPNRHVLEKMISGGYLGGLCYAILVAAAEEGVISQAAGQALRKSPPFGTPFLSTILSKGLNKEDRFRACPESDLTAMASIVAEVIDRAALLTAINIAAPVIKSARTGAKKKYCISANGTMYFKLHSFKERAENYLAAILKPYSVDYKIVQIEEAPLIGTAVAGLVG
jgi:hexokinase